MMQIKNLATSYQAHQLQELQVEPRPTGEDLVKLFQSIQNTEEATLNECQQALAEISFKYEQELYSQGLVRRLLTRINLFNSDLRAAYKQARTQIMEVARHQITNLSVDGLAQLHKDQKSMPTKAFFSKDLTKALLYQVSIGQEKRKDTTAEDSYHALRAVSNLYYKEMKSHNFLVRLFMKYNPSSNSFRNVYKGAHDELVEISARNFGKDYAFYYKKFHKTSSIKTLERIEKITLSAYHKAVNNRTPVGFGWEVKDHEGTLKAYLIGTVHFSTGPMNNTPFIKQAVAEGNIFFGELNGVEIQTIKNERSLFSHHSILHGIHPLQLSDFNSFMDYEIARKIGIEKKGRMTDLVQGLETLEVYEEIVKYEKTQERTALHKLAIKKAANKVGHLKILPEFLRVFLRRSEIKNTFDYTSMFTLWQQGDMDQMTALVNLNYTSESRKPYLTDRNQQWWHGSPKTPNNQGLKAVFERNDGQVATIFAGTAHFSGDDSLIKHIRDAGYIVEPMQVNHS